MITRFRNPSRRGISLVEILIGILVLGIGVISLATLFPVGLLKMKRAVNEVRGTIEAQSAWNEVRIRNLLAPPFGPPASYFSQYPTTPAATAWPVFTNRPITGEGIPVIIDPLWMIQANTANYADHFGGYDFVNAAGSFPPDGLPDTGAPHGGEGILRARGGLTGSPLPLALAWQIFASADDLVYGDREDRVKPFQAVASTVGPTFLTPTNRAPFAPGLNGLAREPRYTWLIIARKVSAGQVYGPGINGVFGAGGIADADDVLENNGPDPGPDGDLNLIADNPSLPARDFFGGGQAAPIGPFDVTIVVFYTRNFGGRDDNFAHVPSGASQPPGPKPTWNLGSLTVLGDRIFVKNSDVVRLQKAKVPVGVSFPEIPLFSYIMDSTFDSRDRGATNWAGRNGYVYRVISKSVEQGTGDLLISIDQKARADGFVLTPLKGAVGVFEKEVP